MSDSEIEKNVREYIGKTVHMSLATSKDHKPWVCEVHFAADDQLNLYFVSNKTTRHCREIAANSSVAGDIVKQHPLEESPHGVYFEGRAKMLEPPDDVQVEGYCQALGRDVMELKTTLADPNDDHRLYKITVDNWAIFGKFGGDKNQKHSLAWSKP